jgi:muramoyltetrapeptide carboxypeptidase LdcA involved in peptidoglycan recycling
MIKPKKLRKGDTVAIVSLSSGLAGEELFLPRFELGRKRLEDIFGIKTIVMPNALKGIDYLYHHPEARAKDLMDAFQDENIDGIICSIGGDDTIRILPFLDFEVIRKNPKIFMGYSDATANHFMMYKAGLVSFHGPCIMVEFAENVSMHDYTIEYINKMLFSTNNCIEIKPSPHWTSDVLEWTDSKNATISRKLKNDTKGYELIQGSGTVRGRLLGGCTSVIQMLIGSEIWPNKNEWEGKILFLETAEDHPTPDFIRYLLRNLLAQGILNVINGIVVGKPIDEKCYDEYKEVYRSVVGVEANRPDLPILYNVNCSHTSPNCIIPYGIEAEINSLERTFTILESPVMDV